LIHVKTHYGESALYLAARNGNIRIIDFLLDEGAHPMLRVYDGESILGVAVRWN